MRIKIRRADVIFSRWIRNRDEWRCKRCGKQYIKGDGSLQNSHFYGRRSESTRFEPDNCDALCFVCHQYFTSNPAEYTAWKLKQLGQRRFDKLLLLKNTLKKRDDKLIIQLYGGAA